MFEVGKKYKKNHNIYECLGIHLFRAGSVAGVMRYDGRTDDPNDFGDIPHIYQWSDEWSEHHEPIVVKERVWIASNSFDGLDRYSSDKFLNKNDIVGSFEYTITDGKLTDVRIVS